MDEAFGTAEWLKTRSFLTTTTSGVVTPMSLGLVRTATSRSFAVRIGETGLIAILEPHKIGVLLQTTTELATDLFQLNKSEF